MGWAYRSAPRPEVLAAAVAVLSVGCVTSWHAMTHYPVQDGERAWAHAVRTGDDQAGAAGGRAIVRGPPAGGGVGAGGSTGAPVAALTDHPQTFATPGGLGGDRWHARLREAPYVLARAGDAVDRAIPGLLHSTTSGYTVIASAGPYVLARRAGP